MYQLSYKLLVFNMNIWHVPKHACIDNHKKKKKGQNKNHYKHFSYYPKTSKEFSTPMLIICPLNNLGAKPLVRGSAIIAYGLYVQ